MEKDLFLMLIALIFSAVFQRDLLVTTAAVDIAYRLCRLLRYAGLAVRKSQKRKCPSSSAKRNGRLRKRN